MTTRNYINLTEQGNLSWADLRKLARRHQTAMPDSTLAVGISPAQSEALHATWHDDVSNITPAPPVDAERITWNSITLQTLPAHECLGSR